MGKDRFDIKDRENLGLITDARVIIDKETGVNYLYVCCGYGGGLTPLCWTPTGNPSSRKTAIRSNQPNDMKVIISGYGRMGHMVEKELARRGIELVAASEDICSVDPAVAKECVVIDFTWPDAFRANYPFIAQHFKAAVVGTTGWNDIEADVFKAFEKAGTPLIYASNFSLGVNALFAAVERVSKMLKGNGYTPAVEETHHIHKLDAPSGTAKSLGKLLEEGLGVEPEITAHRIGEVPGIHASCSRKASAWSPRSLPTASARSLASIRLHTRRRSISSRSPTKLSGAKASPRAPSPPP